MKELEADVAYGLRLERVPRAEIDTRDLDALALVEIGDVVKPASLGSRKTDPAAVRARPAG